MERGRLNLPRAVRSRSRPSAKPSPPDANRRVHIGAMRGPSDTKNPTKSAGFCLLESLIDQIGKSTRILLFRPSHDLSIDIFAPESVFLDAGRC